MRTLQNFKKVFKFLFAHKKLKKITLKNCSEKLKSTFFTYCLCSPNRRRPVPNVAYRPTVYRNRVKSSSYLSSKFSRVPLTIVRTSEISTMVNCTLLNFGKRYKDN